MITGWPSTKKHVSKIRKYMYHNHTMQTNPRHREEEPQNNNNHKTLVRKTNQEKLPVLSSLSKWLQN